MDNTHVLQSDLIDIIFEKRNKKYGAYTLRKFYKNRLSKALAITVCSAVVLCSFTLMPGSKKKPEEKITVWEYRSIPPVKKEVKKIDKPISKKLIAKPKNTQAAKNRLIIEKDSAQIITIDGNKNNTAIADQDFFQTSDAIVQQPGVGSNGDVVLISDQGNGADVNTEPLESPEVMPFYPGGMEALTKFLKRNLTNPRDMDAGEQISVKIKFVVDYDGKPQSFTVVQDGGDMFNKEVVRVLQKMPKWVPGKSKGKNVAVYYTIPVKFVGE